MVGSSGSLATTIAFIYVLAKFPGFLRHIKSEGAEAPIVLQLYTFYRLNVRPSPLSYVSGFDELAQIARFIFRIMFCLPLLTIGIDAVAPGRQIINRHP